MWTTTAKVADAADPGVAEPSKRSTSQQEGGQRLLERDDVLERRIVVIPLNSVEQRYVLQRRVFNARCLAEPFGATRSIALRERRPLQRAGVVEELPIEGALLYGVLLNSCHVGRPTNLYFLDVGW
eukprot:SAG31_NODE_270_length_18732_cov_9.342618_13_plen_126_part_00